MRIVRIMTKISKIAPIGPFACLASGRRQRIGVVALARKLLVALWRFVATG